MGQSLFSLSSNTASVAEKKERIMYAALSGFFAGTICVVIGSFINNWLFPELPLYLEWQKIFLLWLTWALIGSALAGVAAFSSEGWTSILLAAFLMAVTILIANLAQSMNSLFLNILLLLVLSLPFTVIMVPLAFIFFWLARRFVFVSTYQGWERRKVLLVNVLVIILLGVLPGLYSRFNNRANVGTHLVHDMLQDAAVSSELPIQLENVEGFVEHKTQPYKLSQVPSVYSTVGVDVTVHYDDGYALLCTAALYPGKEAYVRPCKGLLP